MRSLEARHAAYLVPALLPGQTERNLFLLTVPRSCRYSSVYDTSMQVAWPLSLLKEQSVLLSNPRTVPAAGIVLSQHPTVQVEGTLRYFRLRALAEQRHGRHGAVKRQWHAESC